MFTAGVTREIQTVVPRARANRDVDDAVLHYLREGGAQAGMHFIGALEAAYKHIARHPAAGLPRYGHELDIPGLRAWHLKRHPYLVFYIEREDRIDVWGVLRGQRDIPSWLREPPT